MELCSCLVQNTNYNKINMGKKIDQFGYIYNIEIIKQIRFNLQYEHRLFRVQNVQFETECAVNV